MVSSGTVSSDCSSLQSSMSSYNSMIGDLASSWKGTSFDSISAKAEEFSSSYMSSISGQMDSFGSACDLYKEYETAKNNYNNATSYYNSAVSSRDSSAANSYNNQRAQYADQMARLKSQIESLLSSVRGVVLEKSSATSTSGSGIATSGGGALGTPSYGSFTKKSYTASNGAKVSYYEYIPNYGTNVSGLPIHVYLHGSGESGKGVLNIGLPKLIKDQNINPSGIVLCLQAPDTSTFSNGKYQDAVVELTQAVAKEYNGDLNKVSMSGHSMGAIAGYKIIERYPNYFSAFVPISGTSSTQSRTAQAKNVKVWAFHGAKDTSVDYNSAAQFINYLQSIGGNARLYTFKDAGHGNVQNYTFQEEYEDENGNKINPLEWAFQQTKA